MKDDKKKTGHSGGKRKGKEWFIIGSIIFWVLITLMAHWPTNSSLWLHLAGALFVGYGFGYGLGASWESEGFGRVSRSFKIMLIVIAALITLAALFIAVLVHIQDERLNKQAQQNDAQYSYCITHSKNIATCNTGL